MTKQFKLKMLLYCREMKVLIYFNYIGTMYQYSQEMLKVFNFHHYDNPKHSPDKKDPRREKYESKGLSIVNLLFSAARGDLAALRR